MAASPAQRHHRAGWIGFLGKEKPRPERGQQDGASSKDAPMAEQRLGKLIHSVQELMFGSRLSHNLVTKVSARVYAPIPSVLAGMAPRRRPGTSTSGARSLRRTESARRRNVSMGKRPHEEDPRETPSDDPRQETDWPNTKQTDRPWKGKVEKDQQNKGKDIDLEKWQESDTH